MTDSKLPFGFDKPEDSPGFLLWKTMTLWQRQVKDALDQLKLTHAQFVVMAMAFWFEGKKLPSNQIEIVKLSGLDKMTVSKALKVLSQKKLVIREESKLDSRAKSVMLTQEGKVIMSNAVPLVEGVDKDFFGALKSDELYNLVLAFQKLIN